MLMRQFLDVIYSSYLLPNITSPIQLPNGSHTHINNIFSNINEGYTSGNIINTISDHLAQFLIIPSCSYSYNSKKEILQRNFKNFKEQKFLSDLKRQTGTLFFLIVKKMWIYHTKSFWIK